MSEPVKLPITTRLRHPMWVHVMSTAETPQFESPQLDKEQTQADMNEAAAEIDRLTAQVERQKAALVQIGVVAMDNAAAPRADLALKFIREIVGSVPSDDAT